MPDDEILHGALPVHDGDALAQLGDFRTDDLHLRAAEPV